MGEYDKRLIKDAKEDVKDYFKPSKAEEDFKKGVSDTWNKVKGLVGGGEDDSAMGQVLKNRKKKFGE